MPKESGAPADTPIGLLAAQVGRALEQAFDAALTAAGGSRSSWLILLAIISGAGTTQAALAEHVGITGPTLVHHLDRLEQSGFVARRTDPANRRIRTLTLTDRGRAAFLGMRDAAMTFDAQLRTGISEAQLATLRRLLERLRTNAKEYSHDRS